MDRWISGRFNTGDAVRESGDSAEIGVMARYGAFLYAAGATLALVWLALPHPVAANEAALLATLGAAYAGAAVVLRAGHRFPRWAFELVVAAGTVLITVAVHVSGRTTTPFVLFYLWGNIYAWYFFSRRRAALQLGLIAASFAVALALHDPVSRGVPDTATLFPFVGSGFARWLITVGTMLVAGLLIGGLRDRVEGLVRGLRGERNFVLSVVDTAAALVMIFDLDGRLQGFNRACERITGYDSAGAKGTRISEFLLVPDEIELARDEWERVVAGAPPREFDAHVRTRSGELRLIAWSAVLGRDAHGDPDHVVATGIDITDRHRGERELARRAARQAAVAELGRRGLEGLALPQLTRQAARLVAEHLELDHVQVWELTPYAGELLLTAGVGLFEDEVGKLTIEATREQWPGYTAHNDGPVLVEDYSRDERFAPPARLVGAGAVSGLSMAIPGPRRPYGVIGGQTAEPREFTGDDVLLVESVAHVLGAAIERWRSEESIRHNALHDPLTGLPNRTLFLDRLGHVLSRRVPYGRVAAVMFLDVDNFKLINDSLGHDTGDRLLREIGPRLAKALRPSDTVARFGGDEFVILCEDLSDGRDALVVADRLQRALHEPFAIGGEEHFLTASIGVALATGRYEGPDELMRDADAAMYRAKDRGRAQCELFDDQMRNRALGRLRMENALRGVLDRDELHVHYQPIVSLPGGEVTGVEALMRWRHSGLGPVSPIEFIPIAEETGMIVPLGAWVLEEVCRQSMRWSEELGIEPPAVSVNLSPRQVADADIVPTVARVIEETRIPPSRLSLEITENVLMSEADSPWNTLHALKRLGVTLMLDDFGTGYSSLSYLKRFPVDVLKIDRSFVDGVGTDAEDSAIVMAVVGMARALELDVVAEGVETAEQVTALHELGCNRAQGFHFARPADAAATAALLRPADAIWAPGPDVSSPTAA